MRYLNSQNTHISFNRENKHIAVMWNLYNNRDWTRIKFLSHSNSKQQGGNGKSTATE